MFMISVVANSQSHRLLKYRTNTPDTDVNTYCVTSIVTRYRNYCWPSRHNSDSRGLRDTS